MEQAFGKIVAILTTSAMLFLVPLFINLQRQENMIQLSIMTDTVEFVDSVRNMGYLSVEMYNRFQEQVRKIHSGVEIAMVHRVNSLHIGENGIETVTKIRTENDILTTLQIDREYLFQKGDYFRVEVKRLGKSLPEQLFLLSSDEHMPDTYVYYGGSVRYEV